MPAYLIYNQTELLDETAMAEYVDQFSAMFGKYGGKVAAATSDFEVREGCWNAQRVVLIEFPDKASLESWYLSDEYQQLIKLRQSAAHGDVITLDGLV